MSNQRKNAIPNVLRKWTAPHAFFPSAKDAEFCHLCGHLRGGHVFEDKPNPILELTKPKEKQ